jgi:hypothetical protein
MTVNGTVPDVELAEIPAIGESGVCVKSSTEFEAAIVTD